VNSSFVFKNKSPEFFLVSNLSQLTSPTINAGETRIFFPR
jgi:hypothetical protein